MLEFTFVYGEMGYELSRELRNRVFGEELTDENEAVSYHLVGYDKTKQIAAARFTRLDDKKCRIDFIAVDEAYRRQYVGDLAIKAIEDKARSLGNSEAELESPLDALPFFEFEHYVSTGENLEKFGKNCLKMKKNIAVIHKCGGCG